MPPPMASDTMIFWLAQAAKQLRENHEPQRRQVHIAAALSIDQSTIYRFEQGETWPQRTDAVVAAYAEDLGIADAREIWELALQLWREEGDMPDLKGLIQDDVSKRGDTRRGFTQAVGSGRRRKQSGST